MTLEQKLGQLQQLDADFPTGKLTDEQLQLVREGRARLDAQRLRRCDHERAQRVAVEESRLQIPLLFAFDVIHGYRTIFPVPLGRGWQLGLDGASAPPPAALEARAAGLHWTFAPMVDIARDARWGRIVEGAGEDPYLGSAFARARVRGFQGDGYRKPTAMLATAKHFVAYGAAEAGREYNTVDISEHALREIYLPPFKAAVRGGRRHVDDRFQRDQRRAGDCERCAVERRLARRVGLRRVVVSDYTGVKELINHGVAADGADAARQALNAGTDIEMVSGSTTSSASSWCDGGAVSMERIDEAVRRVLRVKERLGLFDDPYVDESREGKRAADAGATCARRAG